MRIGYKRTSETRRTVEDVADEVRFLRVRRAVWPAFCPLLEGLIRHDGLGVVLDAGEHGELVQERGCILEQRRIPINPRVSHTVGELLLLPPEDGPRKISLEDMSCEYTRTNPLRSWREMDPTLPSGAQSNAFRRMYFSILGQPSASTSCADPLLNIFSLGSMFMATSRKALSRKGTRASRPQAIVDLGGVNEFVNYEAKLHDSLVGPQTVRSVEVLDSPHTLLVERLWIRSGVEVQVACKCRQFSLQFGNDLRTAEDLVTALSTEDHLHTHGLNLPAEQVHRRTRTNGGNIVGLKVVDHVRNGIEPLLNCEGVLMVDGAEVVRRFPCRQKVRRVFETDGERVQLRPGGKGHCSLRQS